MATGLPASSVQSPGQSSLGALRRFVLDFVQGIADPDLIAVADRSINRAMDRLNTRNWQKLLHAQTITVTDEVADYEINQNFKAPRSLELLNSSSNPLSRLPYTPWRELLEDHPRADTSGSPQVYSVDFQNRMLVLNVKPTASWVTQYPFMRSWHYARFPYLVDASNSHGGPPEFNGFIGWYARFDLSATRGSGSFAQMALSEANKIWRDLVADDNDIYTDWSV